MPFSRYLYQLLTSLLVLVLLYVCHARMGTSKLFHCSTAPSFSGYIVMTCILEHAFHLIYCYGLNDVLRVFEISKENDFSVLVAWEESLFAASSFK